MAIDAYAWWMFRDSVDGRANGRTDNQQTSLGSLN